MPHCEEDNERGLAANYHRSVGKTLDFEVIPGHSAAHTHLGGRLLVVIY